MQQLTKNDDDDSLCLLVLLLAYWSRTWQPAMAGAGPRPGYIPGLETKHHGYPAPIDGSGNISDLTGPPIGLLTWMMNRVIGFPGLYAIGLTPSRTPAWGGAPVELVAPPPAIALVLCVPVLQ
jgi:hypothetical protein